MNESTTMPQADLLTDRLHQSLSHLSFSRIGEATGVSSESVRRYFAGQRPPASFIEKLCEVYGLSANWLLLGTGPRLLTELPNAYASIATSAVLVDELARRAKLLLGGADQLVETKLWDSRFDSHSAIQ